MPKNKKKKIILSGGGTAGPVVPLFFIYRRLKDDFDFLFVGSYQGLEKKMVETEGIPYKAILAGKLRRYFSFQNFFDLFKIFIAFWQSLFLILKERPNLVISAGGFVSVPLVFASWCLRVPVLIHQQDVLPGLANKLMAPFSKIVTLTFEKSARVYGQKAHLIGNIGIEPEALKFIDKKDVYDQYRLNTQLPLILVLGGGTGSLFINNLIFSTIRDLSLVANVVHISGQADRDLNEKIDLENYFKFNFLDHQEFIKLLSVSDLVVSRCGLSTLSEISFLKKTSILIPMPNSHQEYNAQEFKEREAALVLDEKNLSPNLFLEEVKKLLSDEDLRKKMSANASQVIKNANQEMISIIKSFFKD